MARPVDPNSERSIAARLTVDLGRVVTRKCVQEWKAKGWPLDDPKKIEHLIKMQERGPKKIRPSGNSAEAESADTVAGEEPHELDIEKELRLLQRKLIKATDFDTAKTLRMQIVGVREVLKSLREQAFYVLATNEERGGMQFGLAVKQAILKIPTELPQQILGLDYADAVLKCEDYAYSLLSGLSSVEEIIE